MTPVSRPIIALGILNVDAGRYSFDARAKSLVAQDLLLLLQSTKTPLTASAENSLFQDVFSVIEPANAVLERHAIITYAANVFMAPSWWLTFDMRGGQGRQPLDVPLDGRVRHHCVFARMPGVFEPCTRLDHLGWLRYLASQTPLSRSIGSLASCSATGPFGSW